MKSTVFARPNLKVFLVGAILVLVVQHVITSTMGQGLSRSLPVNARDVSDEELQALIRQAAEFPSTEIYMRVSHYCETRGDYKRALIYLRRAEKFSQSDDGME